MLQRFCKSDQLGLLQPNCRWQTVNFAFIEHKSILYYVHVFLENSSIFSDYFFLTEIFGITWIITYSRKLHSLKTSGELFWIILRLILVVFT